MKRRAWLGLLLLSTSCTSKFDYGFVAHLEEAIALNTERQPIYADMTGNASSDLSMRLIGTEQISLSVGEVLDERAQPFHDEGIPIVAADFVSMKHVADVDRPPEHTGGWSTGAEAALAEAVAPLREVDPGDFEMVCALIHEALETLEEIEHRDDVHLAMTRHLLESTGLAALHAIDYAEHSDGRTEALSRDLVEVQLGPLDLGLNATFDQRASEVHALGAGIIYNDVPPIPFVSEYEAWLRKRD